MKTISLFLIFMAQFGYANDCIPYFEGSEGTVEICVGDKVLSVGFTSQVENIRGFFKSDAEKPVLLNDDRVGIESIAMTKGCIEGICVGDRVVKQGFLKNYITTVIGINPHWSQPLIVDNNLDIAAPIKEIYLTFGCLKGFCVGDTVYTGVTTDKKIIGINPFETKSYTLNDGSVEAGSALALDQDKLSPYVSFDNPLRSSPSLEYSLDGFSSLREAYEVRITTEPFEFLINQ